MYTLNYGYKNGANSNNTTNLVSLKQYFIGDKRTNFEYTYNAVGNITQEKNGFDRFSRSYNYDDQYQLTSENISNGIKSWKYNYTYDTYGNMRSKSNAGKTDTYSYESLEWLDLLTKYNGKSITYDKIGNPLTYYDGTTFTWEKGRILASAKNTAEKLSVNYKYDVDGNRIGKTVNKNGAATDYKYYIQDSKIVAETRGNNKLEFIYDDTGSPYALIYNGTKYYYITNLQGDVVRLMDASGKAVADYTYNAWGKTISYGGTMSDINPLRYRGYYYDTDTDLYYLNSRYYDPETCRFINADDPDVLSANTGLAEKNLFAYCDNNPVMRKDDGGEFWHIAAGAVIGAAVSMVAKTVQNMADGAKGKEIFDGVVLAGVTGAASGALGATSVKLAGQVLGNAFISMTENVIEQKGSGKSFDLGEFASSGLQGAIGGLLGGAGSGGKHMDSLGKRVTKGVQTAIKTKSKKAFKNTISYYLKNTVKYRAANISWRAIGKESMLAFVFVNKRYFPRYPKKYNKYNNYSRFR